jgi:hypothetical protein
VLFPNRPRRRSRPRNWPLCPVFDYDYDGEEDDYDSTTALSTRLGTLVALAKSSLTQPCGVPRIAVFGLSLTFVFLILAALYESWSLPVCVLISTPVAVLGAFLALWSRHF